LATVRTRNGCPGSARRRSHGTTTKRFSKWSVSRTSTSHEATSVRVVNSGIGKVIQIVCILILGTSGLGLAVIEVFLVERTDSVGTRFRVVFGTRWRQRAETHYGKSLVRVRGLGEVEALNGQPVLLCVRRLNHEGWNSTWRGCIIDFINLNVSVVAGLSRHAWWNSNVRQRGLFGGVSNGGRRGARGRCFVLLLRRRRRRVDIDTRSVF
jgi:hypothetical protein